MKHMEPQVKHVSQSIKICPHQWLLQRQGRISLDNSQKSMKLKIY
ncbi:hypothetical protein E2I00_007569 [Balaenoptera physalus]|uniref:Uncharacterized protein n=1 Tax=Balaenoptera physalus TaxID=9770 RepID=A0A643BRF3_BALPH|nr:hypothetical protein E2I00_007569 [Balaenoptera physalus]